MSNTQKYIACVYAYVVSTPPVFIVRYNIKVFLSKFATPNKNWKFYPKRQHVALAFNPYLSYRFSSQWCKPPNLNSSRCLNTWLPDDLFYPQRLSILVAIDLSKRICHSRLFESRFLKDEQSEFHTMKYIRAIKLIEKVMDGFCAKCASEKRSVHFHEIRFSRRLRPTFVLRLAFCTPQISTCTYFFRSFKRANHAIAFSEQSLAFKAISVKNNSFYLVSSLRWESLTIAYKESYRRPFIPIVIDFVFFLHKFLLWNDLAHLICDCIFAVTHSNWQSGVHASVWSSVI